MATDEVGIYNQAVSFVGSDSTVASTDEVSREAEVCSLWYDSVVQKTLRAAPWPSARKVIRLALLAERDFTEEWTSADPEPNWKYAYSYPSDLIRPRYLHGYGRFTTGLTDGTRSILTDVEDAILIYTSRQKSVLSWENDLQLAITYALAAHICMPLSGKLEKTSLAIQLANQLILDARMTAANQDTDRLDSIPDWIAARGFGNAQSSKFIFPDGPTFSVSDVQTRPGLA